jgi:PncC family amidohydrolase
VNQDSLELLASRLQALCLKGGLSVATAESCTGGLIAKLITDIAGSSGYFRGGVVAYSNAVKESLLGVPTDVLSAHGAVSAQTALAMAAGVAARTGADLAVAVTGVSGPGGGGPGKPVGLTYVAVAHAGGGYVSRYNWAGDRAANRESTARAALEMLAIAVEAVVAAADASTSVPETAGE